MCSNALIRNVDNLDGNYPADECTDIADSEERQSVCDELMKPQNIQINRNPMTASVDNEQCDIQYWEISKNTTEHDEPVSNIAGTGSEEFDGFVLVPPHSQRLHYVPP